MSRFFDLVSKPAREMSGFFPAPTPKRETAQTQPRLIRLDSNENPFGPSPRAVDAMQWALAAANSYPDDDCGGLRHKLAMHHDVPKEQVLVTAGSTAMLSLLCQTMLAPGLNAVTSQRSFLVYSMAVHATGAGLIEAPMREDGIDLQAILGAINEDTRLVFLANPTIPREPFWKLRRSMNLWRRFRGTWWWFWTRPTTSSRCTSRRGARWSIRDRWITCGRARAWWCCERFRRRTGWRGCAWDMEWDRLN